MNASLYVKRARTATTLLRRNPRLFLETSQLVLRGLRPVPDHPVTKTIEGVRFEFDFALDPNVRDMYRGYYEYPIVRTIRRLLRKGDTFVDVGANIGYMTAVAMGRVGKQGRVYSFEPVPAYFERLSRLAAANPALNVTTERIAIGETPGTAHIDVSKGNIGWNTMIEGWMPRESVKETVEAPIRRLDEYMETAGMPTPALIKVDTEGFDFAVLKSLSGFFERTTERPPIVSEISPGAYDLLDGSLGELWAYMDEWGYSPYSLIDGSLVNAGDLTETANVLFSTTGR